MRVLRRRPGFAGHGRALPRSSRVWIPATVLVLGLLNTGVSAHALAANLARDQRARLEVLAAQTRSALAARIAGYAAPLSGMRAVLAGPAGADRARFDAYAELAGEGRPPGVRTFAFNRLVSAEARPAFEAAMRADTSVSPGGYPGFTVWPPPDPGADAVVVDYVWPDTGNESARGFDTLSDPDRAVAVAAARDRGAVVATAPVDLVQAGAGRGYLLYLAVYDQPAVPATVAERRRGFLGVVAAAIDVGQMFAGPVTDGGPGWFARGIELRDAGFAVDPEPDAAAGTLLVDTVAGAGPVPASVWSDLEVAGRLWRLRVTFGPGEVGGNGRLLPWLVATGGVLVSVLLAGLLLALANSERRARALAGDMTVSLRQRESDLAHANRRLAESNVALAQTGRVKDEFLSSMSHELRTPLASIAGFSQLLRSRVDELDDDERREAVIQIGRGADHLCALVDEILDVADRGAGAAGDQLAGGGASTVARGPAAPSGDNGTV